MSKKDFFFLLIKQKKKSTFLPIICSPCGLSIYVMNRLIENKKNGSQSNNLSHKKTSKGINLFCKYLSNFSMQILLSDKELWI